MSRVDLLALTPEALASLSNLGLVKRAQRDLAAGVTPEIHEEADGTVVGAFADGVVARLPPSTTLKDAPCTCGASTVCRHRLGVALAYKSWHVAKQEGGPPPLSARVPTAWSPKEISDETLEKALGRKMLDRARATLKKGMLVTLETAMAKGDVPTARLPSCTVRFLVPGDVSYARCDCALAGGACEHLALAVWAFREMNDGVTSSIVSLGDSGADPQRIEVLDDTWKLAREIIAQGIANMPAAPARFAGLRTRLEDCGMTWVHAIIVDLEIALEGYRKRSALYGTREVTLLVTELCARIRAGKAAVSELPARFVLGEDEAKETLLDHLRLVSLGARIRADERTRFADVYLADPDTSQVLVMRKRWDFDEKTEPQDGPALADRPMAARATLKAIAHGQIVSKVVTRHANRSIELGTSRVAQTSVTPQRGDYGSLPAGLLVRDLAEHAKRTQLRPPRVLRPRVLAEEVHVVEISRVDDVRYSTADQRLIALLLDASGNRLVLTLRHRRAAPFAIEATAAALAKPVRFIAGDLVHRASEWEIDPLAIAGDRLVVPDLAPKTPAPNAPGFDRHLHHNSIDDALTRAESSLEEQCSVGLEATPRAILNRVAAAAQSLDDVGLAGLANRFRILEGAGAAEIRADRWINAALRVTLTREAS